MFEPVEHAYDAAVATLLLAAGIIMEDASVAAVAAPREAAARVDKLAAAGSDIAVLTAAAAVLARLAAEHGTGSGLERTA